MNAIWGLIIVQKIQTVQILLEVMFVPVKMVLVEVRTLVLVHFIIFIFFPFF